MSHLAGLTREKLHNWAGARSFERGADYFARDLVHDLLTYRETLTATVEGTEVYQVRLSFNEKGAIDYVCSCPYGEEGNFCKHCVAVGLAYLNAQKRPHTDVSDGPTLEAVREYLGQQPVTWLADMVMAQVLESKRLRDKLLLAVARKQSPQLDLNAYRRNIREAVRAVGNGDVEGVRDALEAVEGLLEEGQAEAVIELTELALDELRQKQERIYDDEEGEIYGLSEQWVELHRQACEQAQIDPVALAHKLFKYEIEDQREEFYHALSQYSTALGEKGRAAYRRLVEDAWRSIPALQPGEAYNYSSERSRLTDIMEHFAQSDGDLAALIEVKKRNLSEPGRFLDIAETYHKAGQHDSALHWAEEGMRVFTTTAPGGLSKQIVSSFRQPRTSQLGLFLAEEYQRRGRHDEAMAIVWQQFLDGISLNTYQKLADYAQRTGVWEEWQRQAIDKSRAFIEANKKPKPNTSWFYRKSDNSLLVEIFLWENKIDDALAAAHEDGCSEQLWLKLAAGLETPRPADALDIYLQRVVPKISETNGQAYAEAVKLLKKAQELSRRLGREHEFSSFVAALRTDHKRKRNFIALLDKMRW